jgi:hypothetical protein
MIDPLAEVVTLLQPEAAFSKLSSGAGRWSVRREETGRPFYCAILDGVSRLAVDGREPMILEKGDFVLIPSAFNFHGVESRAAERKARHRVPGVARWRSQTWQSDWSA